MQSIASTSQQEFFFCRSCFQHQPKDKHSLKACLKTKRDFLQAIEDRRYTRETFVTNNKVRIISKAVTEQPEAIKAPEVAEQHQKAIEKPQIIQAIFKRPRVLRRRIAPVVHQWNYTSS